MLMRYAYLAIAFLWFGSPAFAQDEDQCIKDLAAKNYQQQASTGEIAKLIANECLRRSHPKEFREVAIGTARHSDARLISEMSDVMFQMAVAYLKDLRGETIHLKQ